MMHNDVEGFFTFIIPIVYWKFEYCTIYHLNCVLVLINKTTISFGYKGTFFLIKTNH